MVDFGLAYGNSSRLRPASLCISYYLTCGYHPCFEADAFSMSAKHHDATETVPEFVLRLQADWMAAQRGMEVQQQTVVAKASA